MDIAVIVSLIATLISVIALVFLAVQLKMQRNQLRLESLTSIHDQLITKDVNDALREIYSTPTLGLVDPKRPDLLDKIEYILGLYDLVGHRARLGLVPLKDLLETDWAVILRINSKLSGFVERERDLRTRPAPYKEGYTWLVQQAEAHRNRVAPGWIPLTFTRNAAIDQ